MKTHFWMSEFPGEWPAQVSAPCIHVMPVWKPLQSWLYLQDGSATRTLKLQFFLDCESSHSEALLHLPSASCPRCGELQHLCGAAPARGGGKGPGRLQSFSRSTKVPSSTQSYPKGSSQSHVSVQQEFSTPYTVLLCEGLQGEVGTKPENEV